MNRTYARNFNRNEFSKRSNNSNYNPANPVAVIVICVLLVIVVFIRWIVIRCENKYVFPGAPIDYYHRLRSGTFRFLETGGGLLHFTGEHGYNHVKQHRKILFLHGNAGSLDLFAEILEHLDQKRGYDVYALEYYTYGLCWKKEKWSESSKHLANKHISEIFIENLLEGWAIMGDPNSIIAAFSIGGGLLGVGYNLLFPVPAQLVFINTFFDLSTLIHHAVPMGMGAWITPFMQTKWKTLPPEPRYKNCIVTIIYTMDDSLISSSQARTLYNMFHSHGLQTELIPLPDGGHALGLVKHLHRVTNPSVLLRSI